MAIETLDQPACARLKRDLRRRAAAPLSLTDSWQRIFRRTRVTIPQRCLAMHFYQAWPHSALEPD